jgi:hypothetical protein
VGDAEYDILPIAFVRNDYIARLLSWKFELMMSLFFMRQSVFNMYSPKLLTVSRKSVFDINHNFDGYNPFDEVFLLDKNRDGTDIKSNLFDLPWTLNCCLLCHSTEDTYAYASYMEERIESWLPLFYPGTAFMSVKKCVDSLFSRLRSPVEFNGIYATLISQHFNKVFHTLDADHQPDQAIEKEQKAPSPGTTINTDNIVQPSESKSVLTDYQDVDISGGSSAGLFLTPDGGKPGEQTMSAEAQEPFIVGLDLKNKKIISDIDKKYQIL